jgi:tRNA(His) guanylyltransferase
MHDELGDRIKSQYEDRTRISLPRRTYTIIRCDGKAFHTLTKGFKKPFDKILMDMMDSAAMALCQEIQGAAFAYVQSDEISVLVTDFANIKTSAWFDGNLQKMVSIAAACATARFNRELAMNGLDADKIAMFDARAFTIPDPIEVENYFIWRQNDASRNSIQMVARSLYSHKQLHNKGIKELHDMIHAKGENWNNYTSGEKRGRVIMKDDFWVRNDEGIETKRSRWISQDGTGRDDKHEIPVFTQNRTFLRGLIPQMPQFMEETK